MHLSPHEKIPEYLLTFTWKQSENTIHEINVKKRSERVWNFWDYFRWREKFETNGLKIKVHISCRIKLNKYFSQKVNTIRDKTDFLALHPYFWTTVLVRNSTSNISVSSSMWKRLYRSFGSFPFHRLDSFYRLNCFYRAFHFNRLQCFYHAFRLYRAFSFYRSFDFYFWVSFRTIFSLVVLGIQECSSVCSIYDIHQWNISQDLHTYLVINHRKLDFSFKAPLTCVDLSQCSLVWSNGSVVSSCGHRWPNNALPGFLQYE